jgi:hypothetical protein
MCVVFGQSAVHEACAGFVVVDLDGVMISLDRRYARAVARVRTAVEADTCGDDPVGPGNSIWSPTWAFPIIASGSCQDHQMLLSLVYLIVRHRLSVPAPYRATTRPWFADLPLGPREGVPSHSSTMAGLTCCSVDPQGALITGGV